MAALPETPAPTRDAIFAAYEADADTGFRPHLGASQIGKSCERALWYDFRWTTPARFPGRILRLFETGQLEEARLVRNLRRTGATVLEVDPETGRQWRVEAHGGHFGGSLDAVALGLLEAPKTWHVVEFKTHSAEELPRAGRQGRRRGQAAALGADADLHAPDRADPGDVPRGLQGHRRSAHRAGPRRRRRRRAAARQGRPRHPRRPAAGAHLRGSRPGSSAGSATTTTSAMATPPPRSPAAPACIRRRSRAAGTAPAGTRRSTSSTQRAGLRPAPLHPRPGARRGGRRRRRSCRLPHARRRHLDQRRPGGGGGMLTLRPYQQAAIDAIYGYFAENSRPPAGRHPDRRRQEPRHGRLHRGRAARLARPAHPDRHPRPRADRAELSPS